MKDNLILGLNYPYIVFSDLRHVLGYCVIFVSRNKVSSAQTIDVIPQEIFNIHLYAMQKLKL